MSFSYSLTDDKSMYIRQALEDLSKYQNTVTNKYGDRMAKQAQHYLVETGVLFAETMSWWMEINDSAEDCISEWSGGNEDVSMDIFTQQKDKILYVLDTSYPSGIKTNLREVMFYCKSKDIDVQHQRE